MMRFVKALLCIAILLSLSDVMQAQSSGCKNVRSFYLQFEKKQFKLTAKHINELKALAAAMRANPNCNMIISGMGNGSKSELQLSWDRVKKSIVYLVDNQHIDRERFIFRYGIQGTSGLVECTTAAEEETGPSDMAPPFPNLRR